MLERDVLVSECVKRNKDVVLQLGMRKCVLLI